MKYILQYHIITYHTIHSTANERTDQKGKIRVKKVFCFVLLALLLLCLPLLSGAENVEVDSRVARIMATYECGCSESSFGVMVSRNGLLTRSQAVYCPTHGKKFTRLEFYFGFLEEGLYAAYYNGQFTFRAYEQFKSGYKEENDIGYIRFAEPVGDQTGWYACKAASDKELKNAYLVFRTDNAGGNIQMDVPSASIKDKKFLLYTYVKGTASGMPVLMTDGNGNPTVIGLAVAYNPDENVGFIRRITSRVYNDMTSDGLFKGSAASSAPSVTSLYREESVTGEGGTGSPQTAGGGWTCAACGASGNTGNFCGNCGSAKPAAAEAGGEWACAVCGQTGNTGNFCPVCGTPQGGTAATAPTQPPAPQTTVNPQLEQIPGETERVKVRLQSVDASLFIKAGDNPNKWIPENAADGNETTCWQYNGGGGQWLQLNLSSAEAVDEIWFKNGFWGYNDKGKDQYSINARPKSITVEFTYGGGRDSENFTLADTWGTDWQRFQVVHRDNVTSVRIIVNSIYTGSYFKNDVCLSEVMLVQHASASGAMPAQGNQTAVIYESRPEVSGCELLDRLSTRSGPGTVYQEPGTFFRNNTWKGRTVRVLKKGRGDGVWWVQVDFQTDNGNKYRVWTGKKRVDVDLDKVSEEIPIGDCDIYATSDTRWGPGGSYAAANVVLRTNAVGNLYEVENGWADVEYYCNDGSHGRVWVPQGCVYNVDTSKDRSGEN